MYSVAMYILIRVNRKKHAHLEQRELSSAIFFFGNLINDINDNLMVVAE